MIKNVGFADRMIRIILAAFMVSLYYHGKVSGTLGIVLTIISLVFVLTSFMSFCPIYYVFKIRSCKKE